ncbi:MAG: phytanoyl-CoA dioxygenase family protein [Phycisphaeraceae bacterium]|nr:phytanoyl-CoA dioxygenase family protein [Phycisphaeraceae bacterium]
MPHRLNPEDVEFFNDQGYLIFDQPVFPAEKFKALKERFEWLLEKWEARGGSPEHLDTPHFADPALFQWLLADEVLDIVEPLLGPDIALWSSHFICKPAGVGKRVPWHEDSAYWKGRLEPMDVLTIWLAIDPSTTENGCMRVVPGTHRDGFSDYEPVENPDGQVFATEIAGSEEFEDKAVDFVLKPNQCSIHHAKLIHGSHANTADYRRCGYTMRYMPATAKHHPDDSPKSNFQIYLARGKDRAGNDYGDPTDVIDPWLEEATAST